MSFYTKTIQSFTFSPKWYLSDSWSFHFIFHSQATEPLFFSYFFSFTNKKMMEYFFPAHLGISSSAEFASCLWPSIYLCPEGHPIYLKANTLPAVSPAWSATSEQLTSCQSPSDARQESSEWPATPVEWDLGIPLASGIAWHNSLRCYFWIILNEITTSLHICLPGASESSFHLSFTSTL